MTRRTLASLVLVLAACASPARREPAKRPSSDEVQEKRALAEVDVLYQKATDARRRGAQEDALSALRAALRVEHVPAKLSSLRSSLHYDIACIELALGRREDALLSLDRAAKDGFAESEQAAGDRDLASLRNDQRFESILRAFRENSRRLRVYDIVSSDSPDLGWASQHRFENIVSPYFAELRTKYRLDSVVSSGKTELEKQLSLVSWVHNRWAHAGLTEPMHEDALSILRDVEAGKRFRCVEYSVVSTQVLQAMGFPARIVGLRMDGASFGLGKGHVVTEVWNNELQKWLIVDGQNNGTWQLDGAVLSAAEVRRVRHATPERLRFVLGASTWMPTKPEPEHRADWLPYFEHLMFRYENFQPPGSDKILPRVDLLYPGERYELLFQGSVDENHLQTPQEDKVYPALGRVHVDLSASTAGKPEVLVRLTNSMPWFARYRVRQNGVETTTKDDRVTWRLFPGKNELVVSASNFMNVEGKPTTIVLDYVPSN